jgi:hypothetical protein
MPIVSSTHTIDAHQQQGGGRYVIERHTDDAGVVHQVGPWLAPEGFDVAARVTARAVALDAQIAAVALEAQERIAADAKVIAVLDTAVKAGTLTDEEIKKAGYTAPSENIDRSKR